MNEATKAELKQEIGDLLGLPFYSSMSQELNRLNENVEGSLDSIIEAVQQKLCDNCEYSCNESSCDRRHNS